MQVVMWVYLDRLGISFLRLPWRLCGVRARPVGDGTRWGPMTGWMWWA